MVGDTPYDIIGAHACSRPAIGVTWGIAMAQELHEADADLIVHEPPELPDAIEALLLS